ncbi:MAG: bifunctional UDP-N-acetylglucosamine diphosphorylase/glucosamine-1-phosphate N-acetyltransferase GlmU [Candidatus Acidiferrales bacterium]
MSRSDIVIVVLAAGKGTRLKSSRAKVLHEVGGRTMVEQVVRACLPLRAREIVAVVGHQADEVRAVVEPLGVRTVLQEPQQGTGHAVLVARRAIGNARNILVVPGDAPLLRAATLSALVRAHQQSGAAATILSAEMATPAGYGRVVRKEDNSVAAIVEDSAVSEEQRGITEINSSTYCFATHVMWSCLAQLKPANHHRELYLTDSIALLRARGQTVQAVMAADASEILGCNTRADLATADGILRARKRDAVMESGVTIRLPETVLIDPDVTIGADTEIEPCVHLLGRTRIGFECTIGTGCVLIESVLEDRVTVRPHSVIRGSHLGRGSSVGPFARLRDGTRLEENAHVGNFVEVKKATIESGAKAMHLSYLGDARIGRDTNIGAGTITCNYDGVHKNTTVIGRRAFIGSDSALVAPVRIGDGAYVAAGSVITENVPPNALGIARGKQVNKGGWATARRREQAGEASAGPKRKKKKISPRRTASRRRGPTSKKSLRKSTRKSSRR